jgi:iduronate 2-sulfatase
MWCRALFVLCLLATAETRAETKPNVLFLMADDLRPELATYGSVAKTPSLDRLMQRSLQFDRAYCQQAVCNPSRSSMLTGRRPDTLKLWSNGLHFRERAPGVTTLPKWFMEHGYQSRCVGKIFHNWHTDVKGDPESWSAPEFLHYANHGDDKPVVTGDLPDNLAKAPRCESRDVADDAYYDGRVAAEAVRVLDEIKGGPFFLAIGFWKPHAPFNAPKKYWDLYDRASLPKYDPARPAGAPAVAFHDGRELRGAPPNQVTFTPEQAAEIRHGYLANVSYMDAQLGKVLDAVDQFQLANNTIVVFVGDHGYHLGEQDLWAKTSNFELDARVPLAIRWEKSIGAGMRTEAITELVDLFPTLVDLCGLPLPAGLEGTSLKSVLFTPAAGGKRAAFTQHPRPAYFDRMPSGEPEAMGYSLRAKDVRYTEWRDWKTGAVVARELYDLRTDPIERQNLIDTSRLKKDPVLGGELTNAETWLHDQFPGVVRP